MKQHQNILPFKLTMLLYPLLMVLAIWVVFWLEVKWDISFNKLGIRPRHWEGLKGIFFSPFIHGDASHLWHNTLPLFILSAALCYFYENVSVKVLLLGTFFTGLATWMIGRDSYHIGVSGVIYMLFGFLFLKGLLTKQFRLLAVSFFVVFVYGGMIWYVTPIDFKISWEGHLSGLLVGFFLATFFKSNIHQDTTKFLWETENYDPELDAFMQCFDADGNFIPTPKIEEEMKPDEVQIVGDNTTEFLSDKGMRLIYHTIKKGKGKKRVFRLR
ncbi:rhomboid family intramembrane serine protease [Aquimarina agarivorans]|uniref:rhomboid family intramembrane serine protease n=1 Tax=Aquimarina agarivorans TaxID=980584 RepID=UPI000248EBA1|nr:rhomboid family intramembrane serine protease [Aquimarina agarivorans]